MTKSQKIWKWKNKSKLCWITKFRESVLFVNNEKNEYLGFSVCELQWFLSWKNTDCKMSSGCDNSVLGRKLE